MIFRILDSWGEHDPNSKNEVCLVWDNWNDFSFYTLFGIFYVDEKSQKHDLGGVKIGFVGQEEREKVYHVDYTFNYIGDNYFSLGNSEEYYEQLNKLSVEIRDSILNQLNDVAKKPDVFNSVREERVVQVSFLRDLHPDTITGQYRRMANGGARLTPYSFRFNKGSKKDQDGLSLLFDVIPESLPPTNIHVLIGRNGVGKTTLIDNMISSLVVHSGPIPVQGSFHFNKTHMYDEVNSFANLISVSFSVFDELDLRSDEKFINGMKYSYIGLRKTNGQQSELEIKDLNTLSAEFYESLKVCRSRGLISRLAEALETLQSDPNFRRERFVELIMRDELDKLEMVISTAFRRLSSGHKIILLTITTLVEKLQEKSLLLMDEPEAHLHPPLLAAFIRSVSDLLIKTNGVAIVSTHSPVILQEVPRSCVWKLRRIGNITDSYRLSRESFGENVGVLTNDVFGLEVTNSGFYKMLAEIVENNDYNYDQVIHSFNNQLGSEARSIVMALIANKR
ncbi:ATP-dependent nuclease [Flavobacterium sp. N2038]|uniref:ATP-dependent nuclease n=1 Tax=Flavobacterium sp. N2038 TaxID=2986829 RepID=UPI002225A591|nr:AAA family ATPase [Flavobacterium sp. N2038]